MNNERRYTKHDLKDSFFELDTFQFFTLLRREHFFLTSDETIIDNKENIIVSLDELMINSWQKQKFFLNYVNYIKDLVIENTDPMYTKKALGFLKSEAIINIEKEEEEEEEDEDDDERDIIEEFIEQNPEARKEDFFQFLKTNGFEIDDESFYINKKGELYSSLSDYEDFVFGLFVKEYKDVLTIYKTVTNTEDLVTRKEKPSEIEVKKMRKKFIRI